jgi:molybdopterin molybdotransferase
MSRSPLASVEQARAAMLAQIAPLQSERVPLDAALGRTLAENIVARGSQPPFDASAMDGWAVRAVDAPGLLRVVGESAAGKAYPNALGPGQAVRIFTGAPVPADADAVILQEDATHEGDRVRVPAVENTNIRPKGMDFAAGETLLAQGTRLDGVALALAAAAGVDPIAVARRPRVTVLATGDELAAPGGPIAPDQIFESVSFGIVALARSWGADAQRLAAAGDTQEALIAALRRGAESDVVITIGGASVGDYDLVKPAAKTLGAELIVESVAVRPGKPVWFARGKGACYFGLPGNPASALVCAHLFLRPILAALQGGDAVMHFARARLASPLPKNGGREHYIRSHVSSDAQGQAIVTPHESQDSARLVVFQNANALLRLAPNAAALEAGALVEVLPLNR